MDPERRSEVERSDSLRTTAAAKRYDRRMPIITILVVLIVLGVVLYLVGLIPMDPTVAKIIRVIAILLVVLWILEAIFGLNLGHLGAVRIGR